MAPFDAAQDAVVGATGSMNPMLVAQTPTSRFVDTLTSPAMLSSLLFLLFAVLVYNVYYLRRERKKGGDIKRSILWINILVAVLVCFLSFMLRIEANWAHTMMTT